MPTLVLMRHGATTWGEENRFAGWADTPLSAAGLEEARQAAEILKAARIHFDLCLTSNLVRSVQTLEAAATALKLPGVIVASDWRLNERHYGALQGEKRSDMIGRHGNAQVVAWRRSYDARPPLLADDDPRWHEQLARLPHIRAALQPRGESLADAVERAIPVWQERIAPALKEGARMLIVAHTSSIRALARAIEGLNDDESAAFRIATAIPRQYEFDAALNITSRNDLSKGVKSGLRYWANRLKPGQIGGI